jgi:HSP20 family protein
MKSLIPWSCTRNSLPVFRTRPAGLSPFHRSFDRLFENFFHDYGLTSPWPESEQMLPFEPRLDVSETGKEYQIKVELPGMEEKDVELSLTDRVLTIKGEKKEEKEEKEKNYHFVERRFGSFSRSFEIPAVVDLEKVTASYQKGVLTVSLPKTPEAHHEPKKITIKAA